MSLLLGGTLCLFLIKRLVAKYFSVTCDVSFKMIQILVVVTYPQWHNFKICTITTLCRVMLYWMVCCGWFGYLISEFLWSLTYTRHDNNCVLYFCMLQVATKSRKEESLGSYFYWRHQKSCCGSVTQPFCSSCIRLCRFGSSNASPLPCGYWYLNIRHSPI